MPLSSPDASYPSAGPAPGSPVEPLKFSGRGGEYFGIWIVNLLLTVLTLGIYSAWAKVRRLQYFHRHTALAGTAFDYHGKPIAILKGRVIAVLLLAAYEIAMRLSVAAGLVVGALLAAALPLLLMRSLRFRAHNTSWRGLRFAFDGQRGGAYRVFLLWPALSAVTLGLLAPLWHQRMKQYQHRHLRFGATGFGFAAGAGGFYRVYLTALVLVLGGALLAILALHFLAGVPPQALGFVPVLVLLAVRPYLTARLQNLVWNGTRLGEHRFESRVGARRLYLIAVTNLIAIVCTLGLFIPFAAIRSARYRLESVAMLPAGSLDEFVAGQSSEVGATGEGAADLFDVDIAL
ncbi:MAG: hypothetical protein BGO72_14000 [Burkholderiales bacterium 70-64]|nr:MAG: hypothetical protein BGO72_14000 [Burkholderiales bacterium 70-64]